METIQINVTDEQRKILTTQAGSLLTVEKVAQTAFDSFLIPVVNKIQGEKNQNILEFLKNNPDVAKSIQAKHNLDDNFKPTK